MGRNVIFLSGVLYTLVLAVLPGLAYQLPDTGQTACYDVEGNVIICRSPGEPLYGQDAQYSGAQPAYQDNGDGTVTDLNTGLMWQKGDSQNDIGGRTWHEACDYCDSLVLPSGGHSDWRLPNRRELMSIVIYEGFDPAIATTYFPECRSAYYWSSTSEAQYPSNGWYVNFYSGFVTVRNKGYQASVRCVRAGSIPTGTFNDNGDGTISDEVTGLMWQKVDSQNDAGDRTWEEALDYCEGLTLPSGAYSDWRLPNVREMESIVDWETYGPAISPLFSSGSSSYWSSSTCARYPGAAWEVYFGSGSVHDSSKAQSNCVRCVRGGQSGSPGTLDHFVISNTSGGAIPAQVLDASFEVLIRAVDANGDRVTSFNGDVSLSNPGGIYPIRSKLKDGQGTVAVKLYTGGTARINCNAYGAYGYSNYFAVTGGGACTGSIRGNVIDCNEAAVSEATVGLYKASDPEGDPELTKTTDSGGNFTFGSVGCGEYEIRAAKDGEGAARIMKKVGATYCTTAFNILIPLNCGTKDTPVVLVPGILGCSKLMSVIVPGLPSDVPADPSDLYIHQPDYTGFWDLMVNLKSRGYYVVACPYDWRITCAKACKEYLIKKIDKALEKSASGKVHIVAHSMGGLVVRAYIQSKYQNDQDRGYRGDIDKVSFVGTPHQGSCNPYYMWEGGDPKTVDNLTDKWYVEGLNLYTRTMKKLWNTMRPVIWNEKNHKAIRVFLQDETPSLLELTNTETFLKDYWDNKWGVETIGNVNTWLKELNEGSDDYNAPSSVMSSTGDSGTKVEARVFAGGKDNSTITWVKTALVKGSTGWANDLYEDGIPTNLIPIEGTVEWDKGDGTVPYDSAVYPSRSKWAALCPTVSKSSHAKLVGDFVDEIVAFLDPEAGPAAARDFSETTGGAELSVGILGDMRVLVTDFQSRRTGADTVTGAPMMEIPGSQCAFDATGGEAGVEDPAAGTYEISYFGSADRDFQLDIEYRDDDVSETYNYRGFRPAVARTFSVAVNPAGSPRITVSPPAQAPTNLRADPYTSGTEKTRLAWTATGEAGLTGYNIYAVAELEPYFSKVTTVGAGTTSYDTADAWSSSSATTVKTYAVAAVKTGGIESFFSNLAQNNDRDHDGLTDAEEPGLGTDPNKADTDGDGLMDGEEQAYNTNPLVGDTDGDGYGDNAEIQAGSDPLDPQSVPGAGLPTVTTADVSAITSTSATSGGNVTSDGGADVTARGVCWSTSSHPSIDDSHTSDGTGEGSFTSQLTGLTPGTSYYVCAYVTNSQGTSYGRDVSFTTLQAGMRYVHPSGSCGGYQPCYSTIQAAIDEAADGDTILVRHGDYYEAIVLDQGKLLNLLCGRNDAFGSGTLFSTVYSLEIQKGRVIVDRLHLVGD